MGLKDMAGILAGLQGAGGVSGIMQLLFGDSSQNLSPQNAPQQTQSPGLDQLFQFIQQILAK